VSCKKIAGKLEVRSEKWKKGVFLGMGVFGGKFRGAKWLISGYNR
jgi:hypothetical protein